MSGDIPLLPPYTFTASTEKNLPFYLSQLKVMTERVRHVLLEKTQASVLSTVLPLCGRC